MIPSLTRRRNSMKIECSCGRAWVGKHKSVVPSYKGHLKRFPGHFEIRRTTSFAEYKIIETEVE